LKLVTVAGLVFLLAACASDPPTQPTVSPPTANSPTTPPPTGGSGSGGSGPEPITGTAILLGNDVQAVVEDGDPRCFVTWDQTGRCRQFDVTTPVDGTLVATLTASGSPRGSLNPDVFLVAPDGSWMSAADGWPTKHVSGQVQGGLTYRVVVISYGPFPDVLQVNVEEP
jgi:hypothetical protein